MSDTVPPIPSPFGANTSNPSSPTSVVQNVVAKNLPQHLDSIGGSHVKNVPEFDKEYFSSWKDRFLVYLDSLGHYLLEILENGPSFVIKCTSAKAIWIDIILAHEGPSETKDTKIASLRLKFNAFKALKGERVKETFTRLKYLLNDLENNGVSISQAKLNATFVNSLPRKWLSMNQTQRANNSIKNDTMEALYGKYNYEEGLIDQIYMSESTKFSLQCLKALISNPTLQDSDTDIEEDQRSSSEFLADLNAEFHERSLPAIQRRFYKRSGRVGSSKKPIDRSNETCFACGKLGHFQKDLSSDDDEGVITSKALMAIADEEQLVGRADARSGQWVEITMKKTSSRVTLDQLLTEQVLRNIVRAIGGKGMRKDKISLKKVVFTKSNVSSSETSPEIPSDSESEGTTQIPLPSLPTLIGAKPFGITKSLTITNTKQTTDKVVKGLKEQIQTHLEISLPTSQSGSSRSAKGKSKIWFRPCKHCGFKNHLTEDCYMKSKCSTCGSIGHMTKEHPEQIMVKRTLAKLNAQPSQGSSRKAPMIPKPYIPCKYCRFITITLMRLLKEVCDIEGYGLVNYNGITFTKVAYVNGLKHNLISISQLCDANFKVLFTKTQATIFNQNNEVILIALRRRDAYVINMISYNEESNACFFAKASPSVNWHWHKRLSHLNFKNLNKLVKQNLVASLPSLNFSKDKTCSACKKGKHHRASFKTKRSFSINKCLHLLHMDLFRPVKPQSINHNKYTLVIVDEYLRYTWVFCLKKKSDAVDCIISFIRKMENLNKVKVKELRSDNGTKFRNFKLEELCDDKGISQNFSSLMVSIIVKRYGKTAYDVFRGRSPNISYFYVFGCPVHIHNHRDHLGKFDEKADDGFFLGYSLVDKAFRVFNIKRQEMEETYHVTFSEDDEAISQTSTKGNAINFNENISFPDDEFQEPRKNITQGSGNNKHISYILAYDPFSSNNINIPESYTSSDLSIINEQISEVVPSPSIPSSNPPSQDRWSREKHIELVNIIGEPLGGITTRSRIRDCEAASAHECLYVNFLSQIEPKRLIEALEEEG
ncbi:retrovirus-related pol polyprotein from transposon TNT 1-94 [Tanacetum coccineum]